MSSSGPIVPRTIGDYKNEVADEDRLVWEHPEGERLVATKEEPGWLLAVESEDGSQNAFDVAFGTELVVRRFRDKIEGRSVESIRREARGLGEYQQELTKTDIQQATDNNVRGSPAEALAEFFDSVGEIAEKSSDYLLTLPGVGPSTVDAIARSLEPPEDEDRAVSRERDVPKDAVKVVSPLRPLTRSARRDLQEYGIIEEVSIREAGRQTVVALEEEPPARVLEEHELQIEGQQTVENSRELAKEIISDEGYNRLADWNIVAPTDMNESVTRFDSHEVVVQWQSPPQDGGHIFVSVTQSEFEGEPQWNAYAESTGDINFGSRSITTTREESVQAALEAAVEWMQSRESTVEYPDFSLTISAGILKPMVEAMDRLGIGGGGNVWLDVTAEEMILSSRGVNQIKLTVPDTSADQWSLTATGRAVVNISDVWDVLDGLLFRDDVTIDADARGQTVTVNGAEIEMKHAAKLPPERAEMEPDVAQFMVEGPHYKEMVEAADTINGDSTAAVGLLDGVGFLEVEAPDERAEFRGDWNAISPIGEGVTAVQLSTLKDIKIAMARPSQTQPTININDRGPLGINYNQDGANVDILLRPNGLDDLDEFDLRPPNEIDSGIPTPSKRPDPDLEDRPLETDLREREIEDIIEEATVGVEVDVAKAGDLLSVVTFGSDLLNRDDRDDMEELRQKTTLDPDDVAFQAELEFEGGFVDAVTGQTGETAETTIRRAVAEWDDAVNADQIDSGGINAVRRRVEDEYDIDLPAFGGPVERDVPGRDVESRDVLSDDDGGGREDAGPTEVEATVTQHSRGFSSGEARIRFDPKFADDGEDIERQIRSDIIDTYTVGGLKRFFGLQDPVAVATVRGGQVEEVGRGGLKEEQLVGAEELAELSYQFDTPDGDENPTADDITDAFPAFNVSQAELLAENLKEVRGVLQWTPKGLTSLKGIGSGTVASLVGSGYKSIAPIGEQGAEMATGEGGVDDEPQLGDDMIRLPDRVEEDRWDVAAVARPDKGFGERFDVMRFPDDVRRRPQVELTQDLEEEIEDDVRGEPAWQYQDGDVVAVFGLADRVGTGTEVQTSSFEPGAELLRQRTTDSSGNLTVTADDGWTGIHPEDVIDADVGDLQAGWITAPIQDTDRRTLHVGWPEERAYHYREIRRPPYQVYNFDRETNQVGEPVGSGGLVTKNHLAIYREPPADEIIGLVPRSDEGPTPPTPIFASEFEDEYDLNPTVLSQDDVDELIGKDILVRSSGGFLHESVADGEVVDGTGFRVPDRTVPEGKWYVPTSPLSDDSTVQLVGVKDEPEPEPEPESERVRVSDLPEELLSVPITDANEASVAVLQSAFPALSDAEARQWARTQASAEFRDVLELQNAGGIVEFIEGAGKRTVNKMLGHSDWDSATPIGEQLRRDPSQGVRRDLIEAANDFEPSPTGEVIVGEGDYETRIDAELPEEAESQVRSRAFAEFGMVSETPFEQGDVLGTFVFDRDFGNVGDFDFTEAEEILSEGEEDEDEEGEEGGELSRGEVETIVEQATEGLAAQAQILGGELKEIRMVETAGSSVDMDDDSKTVIADMDEDAGELIRRAIGWWAENVDRRTVDVPALNERREALNEQFPIDIPMAEEPAGESPPKTEVETADNIRPELGRKVSEALAAANFPVKVLPGDTKVVDGQITVESPTPQEWRDVLEEELPVYTQGRESDEVFFAEVLTDVGSKLEPEFKEDINMSKARETLGVMEEEPPDAVPPETEEQGTGQEVESETVVDFRPDIEEPFTDVIEVAMNQSVPSEDREEKMMQALEQSGLYQEQVPGLFTDAVAFMTFPRGGVSSSGRGFAEEVTLELGGKLSGSVTSELAVPPFTDIISTSGPLIEVDSLWETFTELVAIVDPDATEFSEITDVLNAVVSVTPFQVREGNVDWGEVLVDPATVDPVAGRSGSLWLDYLAYMKDVSGAWWAAQRVVEARGNPEIRRVVEEEELRENAGRGTAAWYLEQAWKLWNELGEEFDPVLFVQDWNDVFRPGETEQQAQERRGVVDLDLLGRPTSQPTEPSPEPSPSPLDRVGGEETAGNVEKTVDDLADEIRDRM